MLEKDIQKMCLDYLELIGIEAWRQNQGAIPTADGHFRRFNGKRGIADISGILPQTVKIWIEKGAENLDTKEMHDLVEWVTFGNRLEIEVKQPGKHPSPDQKEFIDMVNRKGGIAFCVHSLEELQQELDKFL